MFWECSGFFSFSRYCSSFLGVLLIEVVEFLDFEDVFLSWLLDVELGFFRDLVEFLVDDLELLL